MLEYTILGIIAVCVIALLIEPICNILEDAFVHHDNGHGRRTRVFHDERAHVPYGDRIGELYLREVMARFRREASNAVRADPSNWLEKIEAVQQSLFNEIASTNPDLLPGFGNMIKGLSYGHILYPHEAKLVDDLVMTANVRPNEDQIAALRIVRPG